MHFLAGDPASSPNSASRSRFRFPVLAALCVALLVLTLLVNAGLTRPWDLALARPAEADSPCGLLAVGLAANPLLSGEVTFAVLLLAALVLGVWRRGGKRFAPLYLLLVAGVLLTVPLEFAGKTWVQQSTVNSVLGGEHLRAHCALRESYPLTFVATENGFPSGSTIRLVYEGTLLWALAANLRPAARLLARVLLVLLVVVLAATRVVVGWHWPTDVVGGVLLGLIAALPVVWLLADSSAPPPAHSPAQVVLT